ncbi:MAG: multifunctional CCA tRNA nucleotidyl transferase/2'3'-cyclic phosphodiesterase/2'nucleotidase/phosphatase [Pseudomonadales bacterium]
MEVYLVGGAVRDELLGQPVRERDWVVVGSTADDLLALGYRQVGRDFPVFLHPETGEEYALARTERKTGPGHQGFTVHADPSVTLEEDLVRRDLTINAIARAGDGRLIDPFGGRADLEARLLRHVSAAFEEDPLRVFRVARFAAALPEFQVADETLELMTSMAERGALTELSAERIWIELTKALNGPAPERFVAVLAASRALTPWFVEFADVRPGDPGPLPETAQRFAAYVSALEIDALDALCQRLKVPKAAARLAAWVLRHRPQVAAWQTAPVDALYRALCERSAFRPDGDLDEALAVIEVLDDVALDALRRGTEQIRREVRTDALQARGLSGKALGEALDGARIAALELARRVA